MTNGEKIKVLLKPRTDQIRIYSAWVEIEIQSLDININFSCGLDWWNAEYKEPTTKNDSADKCIDRWDINGKEAEAWIVNGKLQIRNRGTIHNIDMPSVTPQEPKTGHWIVDTHKIRAFGEKNETHDYSVHCDKCNYAWDYTTDEEGSLVSNFCPNCGTKMIETQKRSDKE